MTIKPLIQQKALRTRNQNVILTFQVHSDKVKEEGAQAVLEECLLLVAWIHLEEEWGGLALEWEEVLEVDSEGSDQE